MSFFIWYGIGFVLLFLVFAQEAYKSNPTIKQAADEVYDIFIRRADMLSTGLIFVAALLGPLLLPTIIYFQFRSWQDGLAVDEDDKREYPWTKKTG